MKRNTALTLSLISAVILTGFLYFQIKERETTTKSTPTEHIFLENLQARPNLVNIKTGDSVMWHNRDKTAHRISVETGNGRSEETLKRNESFSITFESGGNFKFESFDYDSIKGQIIVKDE